MNRVRLGAITVFFLSFFISQALSKTMVVRPVEIDDVLYNPGMGFTSYQRFEGDPLNRTKNYYADEYRRFDKLSDEKTEFAPDHPKCTIAYQRIYWNALEPEKGRYNWELIDKALALSERHGQTLMLRIAPYGRNRQEVDVPKWYRDMVGDERDLPEKKWLVDPENPRYVQYYGGLIRAVGKRYDGHPWLESVDLGIVGSWAEGAGSKLLKQETREALVDAYIESFIKTPLVVLLMDKVTNDYINNCAEVGWRVDCLGDMGGFGDGTWSHMNDRYPQAIIELGMREAWKKRPVSLEVCWIIEYWFDKGWDIDPIIDESLKWHVSSINAKSAPIPKEWRPNVERWLKKMGYRFVLRKFTYPSPVTIGGSLKITSWWDNKGVAPCYKDYPLALRLKNDANQAVLITSSDIRTWLPGDNLHDEELLVPKELPPGVYQLQIAMVDRVYQIPKIHLAVQGRESDGWCTMGEITIE